MNTEAPRQGPDRQLLPLLAPADLLVHLAAAGMHVVEVDRPNRQLRRRQGKTDSLDAVEAARAAQAGRALGAAKSRDGNVEAIRALVVAKRSARSTKVKTMNQIRHLGFTAPDPLRARLSGVSRADLASEAASLRPRPGTDPVVFATKTSLRLLGRRVLALDAEKVELDGLLEELVTATAPALLAVYGVGVDTAARSSSPPATTPTGCAAKLLGRTCVACRPSRRPREGLPSPAQPQR